MTYESNVTISQAVDLLADADGPLVIFTHAKPDGDALGSVIALAMALQQMGKAIEPVVVPPVPRSLSDLAGSDLARVYSDKVEISEPALVVIVDTGAKSQLGPLNEYVEKYLGRTLIVDHHLNGDVEAAHKLIDSKAAACCEIIADLVETLQERADQPFDAGALSIINDALFVGIASDTGWFRFSNTRPATHRLAAKLLEAGVDQSALFRQTEQTERMQKLRLITRALDNLEVLGDGRAALMALDVNDFEETGAAEYETERIIDIPQQVEDFELFIVAAAKTLEAPSGRRQQPREQTKLSFRAKPGVEQINVAELAAQFGGGGHALAAGATVDAPLEEVLPQVRQAVDATLLKLN